MTTPQEEQPQEQENGEREEKKRRLPVWMGFLVGHANEFMISMAAHAAILFVISLFPVKRPEDTPRTTMIIESAAPPETDQVQRVDVKIQEKAVEVLDQQATVEQDALVEEPVETQSVSDLEKPAEIQAVTAGTTDVANAPPAILGVGAGTPTGGGLPYGYKSRSANGKKGAMHKHGGAGTESAVDLALRWLAEHQEYDGSWDPTKYQGSWDREKVSSTGLALLAFLGAGYSENVGPFKKTVRKGFAWLNQTLEAEKDEPRFGKNYGSAIALMALSEASIFGSSSTTRMNADRIAQMFLNQHTGAGWIYSGGGDDFSVSGWVALGLKSAQAADLESLRTKRAEEVLRKYKEWVPTMCLEKKGEAYYFPRKKTTPHMTWVGMFQYQFLGFPKNDPFLLKAAENSLGWIDSGQWIGGPKPGDPYGIYYGTLAAFQYQGALWKRWNPLMKTTLLESQCKGDPRVLGGSWDPTVGVISEDGGRVMMTSMMCLCLEIYYRYEMMN